MSLSLTRSLVTALAIASLAFVGAPASAGGNAPTPISSARHQAVGSSVTVRGTVTVPSGAFDAGFAVTKELAQHAAEEQQHADRDQRHVGGRPRHRGRGARIRPAYRQRR